MFYRLVRALVSFALRLFWRVKVQGASPDVDGPVIYVGNHPNSLIDPALVFIITSRHVTFLAKAPLFKTPLIGQVLKGLQALPVYRRQDDPSQMGKNEGTFEAAAGALKGGRAITLFPEGKSHSEPSLSEIKTGAARIALRSAREGAALKIVPVGLTYAEKHRFRSEVLIEVGEAIDVAQFLPTEVVDEAESVRALTDAIATGLRKVTLNLARWEDLPLIRTGEALYAFRQGNEAGDPERLRRFAEGIELFRREQPERFERLRDEVTEFKHRLDLVHADPTDLTVIYRRPVVYRFILRNMAALFLGFPLFLLGVVAFFVPFYVSRLLVRFLKVELDLVATVKFATTLLLAPIWWASLTFAAWHWGGTGWAWAVGLGTLPLALHTRYFLERRSVAFKDLLVFLTLGQRARLKARLLVEGERLAGEIEKVADEIDPRLGAPAVSR